MSTQRVRNVNEAYHCLQRSLHQPSLWKEVSPRGMRTWERPEPFITIYDQPQEYVLFNAVRDANPFFHFMESLWILAGNADVATLAKYNSQIGQFSDNGQVFHAPYGYRMRRHFCNETFIPVKNLAGDKDIVAECIPVDQIKEVLKLLRKEPDTRRAVIALWDPRIDIGSAAWDRTKMDANVKDIPCNDLIFFKLRSGVLNMTVCCRSNDAILGAYGANAVQFGVLLEFMAAALHVQIGTYTQISDSFHVYVDTPQFKRAETSYCAGGYYDPYADADSMPKSSASFSRIMGPHTMSVDNKIGLEALSDTWLQEVENFIGGERTVFSFDFFKNIAVPIADAWGTYKGWPAFSKNVRIGMAQEILQKCAAEDWRAACHDWLARREEE